MFNPPAIDLSVEELLSIDTPKRARIVGMVVSHSDSEFTLNDGKGQVTVLNDIFEVETGKFYRVLINARNRDTFDALAVHPIKESDVEKYRKIVALERRVKRRWQ